MVKPLLNVLVTKFSDRYFYDAAQGKYFHREALSTNTNLAPVGAVQEEEE
ncbi:MAG: hypothetical protein H7Z11_16990 [Verrucomicrobia bacterium]|nr:hypothetical protein [Leptolyngbya sp. ES-bin-22]